MTKSKLFVSVLAAAAFASVVGASTADAGQHRGQPICNQQPGDYYANGRCHHRKDVSGGRTVSRSVSVHERTTVRSRTKAPAPIVNNDAAVFAEFTADCANKRGKLYDHTQWAGLQPGQVHCHRAASWKVDSK